MLVIFQCIYCEDSTDVLRDLKCGGNDAICYVSQTAENIDSHDTSLFFYFKKKIVTF